MNPLDLPGPAFLKFYIGFGIVVIAIARWFRSRLQNAEPPHRQAPRFSEGYYPKESEAYHIAYLRGGAEEIARTRRVLREIEGGAEPKPISPPYAADIAQELEHDGLVFRGASQRPFYQLTSITLLMLVGLAAAKIIVALSRGRSNIGFLVLLAILFAIAAAILLRPPRISKAAQNYLAWLDRAHDGLLSLVNQGRQTTPGEVVLCAAIYGLGPITTAPISRLKSELRKEDAEKAASDSGGGIDTSSGGGSSCGGGCGGGGCGGCGS